MTATTKSPGEIHGGAVMIYATLCVSNAYIRKINDISLARYDIRLTPNDIFAKRKYDIISVPSYAKRISYCNAVYHMPKAYITRSDKERISLK